jgi:L-ornithine N5-oxygenase
LWFCFSSVNSIFNPEFIDTIYPKSYAYRASLLADARATNYSVVRLELIEHLFEVMYHQKRTLGPDETKWPHRILAGRQIVGVEETGDGALRLKVAALSDPHHQDLLDGLRLAPVEEEEESLDVDLVICATGYKRTAHVDMLRDTWHLLPEIDAAVAAGKSGSLRRGDRWVVETGKNHDQQASTTRVMEVGRDYGVKFSQGAVAPGSGIWLQGCCEATHGVSGSDFFLFRSSFFHRLPGLLGHAN